MLAEVIAIGDELTSGQRLDTNSQWISQRLGEAGIRVGYHTTVGDELEAGMTAFRTAVDRCDLVISTGGLGPTADDLTRDVLARVAGVDLLLDEAVLEHIRSLFARRGRPMPERNVVQAMFPRGSRVVPNPHGTAPGIDLEVSRPGRGACRVIALPGVPAELFEMWSAAVAPTLVQSQGRGRVICHRLIKCFGVGESELEAMLPDLIRRGRSPSVGITVSEATITLRITAAGSSVEECRAAMGPTEEIIHRALGDLVFGYEQDELEHAVLRLLYQTGATLATAEWGTAGTLAGWLGEAAEPGAYVGSVVVRNWPAAVAALGLPAEAALGAAASRETALSMAAACRKQFGADYALAVAAFPTVPAGHEPPERVHFAVAGPEGLRVDSALFAGHPAVLKPRAAKQALNFLRHLLLARVRSGRLEG